MKKTRVLKSTPNHGRRDKIEVELLLTKEEVWTEIQRLGGWARRTLMDFAKPSQQGATFPKAPCSKAEVENWVTWYKILHKPGLNLKNIPKRPNRYPIIHELRQKGFSYKQIAALYNTGYDSIVAHYWRWRTQVLPGLAVKKEESNETDPANWKDLLYNSRLPDSPRSPDGSPDLDRELYSEEET